MTGSRKGKVQELKWEQLSRRLRNACTARIWRGDAERTANSALTEQRRPGWDVTKVKKFSCWMSKK